MRIGLIGAGIMGHGMALNLLHAGYDLGVVAHRNRIPVDDLVARGAREAPTVEALTQDADAVLLCVTGSPAARSVIDRIAPVLAAESLIIDCTTNAPDASAEFAESLGARYVEAPVTGGATQAKDGVLGAIVGCDELVFERAKTILSAFCKRVERFGEPGMAARAKLVSNFLALGTATLVIETFRQARDLGIDWRKLYELAQLGSCNSVGMSRIMDAALEGDYGGYVFSVSNTAKDLGYFCDMVGDDASDLSAVLRLIHDRAVAAGQGDRMLSEMLDPEFSAP